MNNLVDPSLISGLRDSETGYLWSDMAKLQLRANQTTDRAPAFSVFERLAGWIQPISGTRALNIVSASQRDEVLRAAPVGESLIGVGHIAVPTQRSPHPYEKGFRRRQRRNSQNVPD